MSPGYKTKTIGEQKSDIFCRVGSKLFSVLYLSRLLYLARPNTIWLKCIKLINVSVNLAESVQTVIQLFTTCADYNTINIALAGHILTIKAT